MTRIVIVGGGLSGLSLAYRLEQRMPDADVLVLEGSYRLGGNIDTLDRDGFRVEAGPNGFLDNKPAMLSLCRDLGLGDRLQPASDAASLNRFLFLNQRMRILPGSLWSFLRSDILSWSAKFRLLTERWRLPRREGGEESIEAFAIRRVGAEVAHSLADAFVTGIHAGDPALLSINAAFPRLAALEREYGSVLGGLSATRKQKRAEALAQGQKTLPRNKMWSFREGLRLLVETLRERLKKPPRVGSPVRRITRNQSDQTDPAPYRIEGEGGDNWTADRVVLTCPAQQQAAILAGLDAVLAEKIRGIAYNRVAVVALGYRVVDIPSRIDGFGYLTPQRERRDVLGVQWCSSIFPDRAPPGQVLLRVLCGGWNRPEMVDWDETRLVSAVRAELKLSMDIHAQPVFHHIVRWDRALPQYHVGHLERVAWIEERLRQHQGLYLGGNAYRGVAMNDCVEQADLLAERLSQNPSP
jgi:protoporphyrinogen/coproporphyrinogen III oxidase